MGSQYVSLYNQTTGDFDLIQVDEIDADTVIVTNATLTNATISTATITTATITTESVTNSTITNLTVGNAIYFPDGTQALPSISFTNDHSMGAFRYGTDQMGFSTAGVLRGLITNAGLVSNYNVQAALQFLCNASSVSAPSYSFVGDPSTGLYESSGGEVSIASTGNQVMKFNNSLITALKGLVCPSLNCTGTSTFSNTITCAAINAGTNPATLGSTTTTSLNCSGTSSFGNTITLKNISSGTSQTVFTVPGGTTITTSGLLIDSGVTTATNYYGLFINKSGVTGLMFGINKNSTTGAVPSNSPFISTYATTDILCIGRGNSGVLNSADIKIDGNTGNIYMTSGTLQTTSLNSGSPAIWNIVGNTDAITPGFRFDSGTAMAANFYGIAVNKSGTDAIMLGVNKNSVTNQVPGSALYISSYNTGSTLSIGRGSGTGFPNKADVKIDGSGNIFITNGTLITTAVSNSGTTTLTGAVACGAITSTGVFSNGSNNLNCGAITSTGVFSNGTNNLNCGAISATGTFNNSTYAATMGALVTTSISNTGTTNMVGAVTCGTLTTTSATMQNTTNQLTLGITNTTTINATAPVASRIYTIPETGANSSFVMTDSNQTINGYKIFSQPVLSSGGIATAATTNLSSYQSFNVLASQTSTDPVSVYSSFSGSGSNSSLGSFGWKFTANANLQLSRLKYNAGSYGSGADVGIFNTSGSLLTSVNIGTGNPLSGSFNYATITGITLSAGTTYVVAVCPQFYPTTLTSTATANASYLTISAAVFVASGSGLAYPGSNYSVGSYTFGDLVGFEFNLSADILNVSTSGVNAGTYSISGSTITGTQLNVGQSGVYNSAIDCYGYGSTSDGGAIALLQGTTTSANLCGIKIGRRDDHYFMVGHNKTSGATGQIPSSGLYITSQRSDGVITLGRGDSKGLPDKADILIDSNGAITTQNNIYVNYTGGTESIPNNTITTYTTWTLNVNNGNTTYTGGVWTINTAGVYEVSYDIVWASNILGYRQAYIATTGSTAGVYANSMIPSIGLTAMGQTGSKPIKFAVGDTIGLNVYQNSGGSLNIATSGSYTISITIAKIQ